MHGSLEANWACASIGQSVWPNAVNSGRMRWDWTIVAVSPPSRRTASTARAASAGFPNSDHKPSAAVLSDCAIAGNTNASACLGALRSAAIANGTLIVDQAGPDVQVPNEIAD
jgi:hypothetical protein